jgi:hypothetical protein
MGDGFASIGDGPFTGEIGVGYSVLGDGARTINQRYEAELLAFKLGAPTGEATLVGAISSTPGGVYRVYERGVMWWSKTTGAHWLNFGPVYDKWQTTGGVAVGAELGYPTTDLFTAQYSSGSFQYFELGCIFLDDVEAAVPYVVHGFINGKYAETEHEKGPLGIPQSDEEPAEDGVGRRSRFAGGVIYWHPDIGAHMVVGPSADEYLKQGGAVSHLGYPIEDSVFGPAAQVTRFQYGQIVATYKDPAHPFTQFDTTQVQVNITTDEAVGGWISWTMDSSGRWQWAGYLKDTGLASYDIAITTSLKWVGPGGQTVRSPTKEATLHGELAVGSPEVSWEIGGASDLIAANWAQVRAAGISTQIGVGADALDIAESVVVGALLVVLAVLVGTGKWTIDACPAGKDWSGQPTGATIEMRPADQPRQPCPEQ